MSDDDSMNGDKNVRAKDFANQYLIQGSENIMENFKRYFCDICNSEFDTYSALKVHLRSKHKFKKYSISFPESGKYNAIAVENLMLHNDDDDDEEYTNKELTTYTCSKCKRKFYNFKRMNNHLRLCTHRDASSKRSISYGSVNKNMKVRK